jgi:hypothetical protein
MLVLCPCLCGHGIERVGENAEVESVLLGEEVEGVEWAGGVKELEAWEEDDANSGRKGVSGHVGDGSDLFGWWDLDWRLWQIDIVFGGVGCWTVSCGCGERLAHS